MGRWHAFQRICMYTFWCLEDTNQNYTYSLTYSDSSLVRAPNQRSHRLVSKCISLSDKSLQQEVTELPVCVCYLIRSQPLQRITNTLKLVGI